MPLLSGGNLDRLVARGNVPLATVLRHLKDALGGLAHLHAINICHLDIKGDNILVGSEGAVLCDYGFAAHADRKILK